MGLLDGLGDVLGGAVEAGLDWLGNPDNRETIINTGVALYNYNNPPETRSMPPVYIQGQRSYGIDYANAPIQGPMPQPTPGGGTSWVDQAQRIAGVEGDTLMGMGIDWLQGQQPGGNGMAGTQAVGHSQHSVFARPANGTGVRMASEVQVIHPITGKTYVYKNMGRCILYQGDLSATKRVNKIAARAKRARGKR